MPLLISGENDLKTLYPEIAKEADGWDPSTILAGTNKKMPWKCKEGHKWITSLSKRSREGTGCPYCGNRKVWSGFNDLQTKFPNLAKEADDWDPSTILAGTNKKMPWKCKEGHKWEASLSQRTQKQTGCPYCYGARVLISFNDLQTKFPNLAKEADGWNPSTILSGGKAVMSWKCSKGHKWKASLYSRTQKQTGCPYCANRKLLSGFNDLQTKFPDIAKEADGWDPSKILAGTHKKMPWKCKKGHSWITNITHRTTNKTGCPYCANQKCLSGFNDLQTKFPDIAKEADGWDPSNIISGSNKKMPWKCKEGHSWITSPNKRSGEGTGCPYCANRKLLSGFNDLQTKFPDIAKEADGWDPSKIPYGGRKQMSWKCSKGHKWQVSISQRTRIQTGCPYCTNQKCLSGFNDLQTKFPEIAKEADGWDPSTVLGGSRENMNWKCKEGHSWNNSLSNRTRRGDGCPYCANRKVWSGFNDLQTRFPELAKEANGWDPSRILSGGKAVMSWKCSKGHIWNADISHRTLGTDCPVCAEYGFNVEKPAWFYLMKRKGEQQLGITNFLTDRIQYHSRSSWVEVETTGPHDGKKVLETEKKLKQWLKKEIGLIPGTHENWYTSKMEVHSLADLKKVSGINTSIF